MAAPFSSAPVDATIPVEPVFERRVSFAAFGLGLAAALVWLTARLLL